MSEERQPELPAKIYAEAVVRSSTGVSLLRSSSLVTAQNVTQFYAQSSLLNLAADRLRQAGFEVLDIGKTSINIAADPDTYERSFKAKLEAIERPAIKEMGKPDTATYINSIDDRPFSEIDLAETSWDKLLDGVVINEPVYYHFQAKLPSAFPPVTTETYLSVPEGVAEGLNATLAHQQGITGKDVKVVMVDSGWYPHPFFAQHHYKVNVVLAPGLDPTNALQDDLGHGTGESANLFAIAPEAELTMVKAAFNLSGKIKNVNANAALQTAIGLSPDIISCSWSSNQRYPILSPYNKLLAATVAEAVSKNIVVIFAVGIGDYGFPAQHPEVIAAGGVYLHLSGSLRGKLEASNFSSSFISPIPEYKGRQVPDVCGLVGQLPYDNYILLPVPPRSIFDLALALVKDGTSVADGWAAFSGTSAAAPQLAGVCALIKQIDRNLSPNKTKQILQQTAHDVIEGFSSSAASARAGPDLATGYGLADAYRAIQLLSNTPIGNEPDLNHFLHTSRSIKISRRTQTMTFDASKLREKLEAIQLRLDEILQTEFADIGEIELTITESNFISRTAQTKAMYSLRKLLIDLPQDKNGKFRLEAIKKKHIFAAKSLLKVQKCQEIATQVLIAATENIDDSISECAAEALGEFMPDYSLEQPESTLERRLLTREECAALSPSLPYPCGYVGS